MPPASVKSSIVSCFDVPELQLLRRRIPARPLASHLDAPQGHDGCPPDGGRVAPAAPILHHGPEGPVAAMASIHSAVRLHLRFGNVHVLVLSKCPCRAILSFLRLPSQLLIGRVLVARIRNPSKRAPEARPGQLCVSNQPAITRFPRPKKQPSKIHPQRTDKGVRQGHSQSTSTLF